MSKLQQEATGHLHEYRDDIRQAVEVMNQGGIILYPTDTIWGIGCDATNPAVGDFACEIHLSQDMP